MNEELFGVLAETLGKTATELSELVKTDDENVINVEPLKELMQQHLNGIETSKKKEGEGMGERLALKRIENLITKDSGFENPDGLKGTELVKSWYDSKTFDESEALKKLREENENIKKSKEISEDDIKKHPVYLKTEQQLTEVLEGLPTKIEEAKNSVLGEFQKKERIQKVKSLALPVFEGMKPVLPEDPKVKQSQVDRLLLSDLDKFDYQFEGDEVLIIDPDTGKRKENAYKQPEKFDDFIKGIAQNNFTFSVSENKQSPGTPPKKPGSTQVQKPKDLAEYRKLMADKSISIEDKRAISQAFET